MTWSLSYGNPAERCLRAWFVAGDTARSGSKRCLGSAIPGAASFDYVAGDRYSLVTVAAPTGARITTDGNVAYPMCTDMPAGSGSYSGRQVCVAPLPVTAGDVTFRVTGNNGDPVQGSPFTVRAEPGRLAVVSKP